MRFNKKDRELARQSAEHHRENLKLAKSKAWRGRYRIGPADCALCSAYSSWCGDCPLGELKQRCNYEHTPYNKIRRLLKQIAWPLKRTAQSELVHAFTDMVRVLDLIASGSCTIAQAKPTERT